MALPIALQPMSVQPFCIMSEVRSPSVRAESTAASIVSASRGMSNENLSIIAAERIVPMGLAVSVSAMSGAEP